MDSALRMSHSLPWVCRSWGLPPHRKRPPVTPQICKGSASHKEFPTCCFGGPSGRPHLLVFLLPCAKQRFFFWFPGLGCSAAFNSLGFWPLCLLVGLPCQRQNRIPDSEDMNSQQQLTVNLLLGVGQDEHAGAIVLHDEAKLVLSSLESFIGMNLWPKWHAMSPMIHRIQGPILRSSQVVISNQSKIRQGRRSCRSCCSWDWLERNWGSHKKKSNLLTPYGRSHPPTLLCGCPEKLCWGNLTWRFSMLLALIRKGCP